MPMRNKITYVKNIYSLVQLIRYTQWPREKQGTWSEMVYIYAMNDRLCIHFRRTVIFFFPNNQVHSLEKSFMASLAQIIGCIFLLGVVSGQSFSGFPYIPAGVGELVDQWSSFWMSDEFRRNNFMKLEEEFDRFENETTSAIQMANDNIMAMKNKFDAVTPVCNTTPDPVSTGTKTTICFKEVIDGKTKYIFRELKITDAEGNIISQSNGYSSFDTDALNESSTSTTTE